MSKQEPIGSQIESQLSNCVITAEVSQEIRTAREEGKQEERERWQRMSVCEAGAENASVLEYMEHWENRALSAERRMERIRSLVDRVGNTNAPLMLEMLDALR